MQSIKPDIGGGRVIGDGKINKEFTSWMRDRWKINCPAGITIQVSESKAVNSDQENKIKIK